MSTTNAELYLAGAYQPMLLYETAELPKLDYPGIETPPKTINIHFLIITASLFIAVITWFNALSHFYEDTFHPVNEENRYQATVLSFGYAVIVTLITIMIYIAYLK